jgi:catechol 2,3-dioxygenase
MRIGHVHLKVADLDRAIRFYRDVLGLKLTADGREAGFDAAFLAYARRWSTPCGG